MDNSNRELGKTGMKIAPVAMGCWPIAGMTTLNVNDADSLATLHAAIDQGVNLFDTAYGYGADGESERLIGRALAQRSAEQRDSIVIASKAGMHWESQKDSVASKPVRKFDASPARILDQCEQSLRRLNVDAIDLYYLHAIDPTVELESSASAFAKLLEQGKICSVGVSNLSIEQMEQFALVCPITAVQPPFNMLQRAIEGDLIPWCQKRSISVVSYWPLMKGLLAGKIRRGHSFDPADPRTQYEVFQGAQFERAQQLLDLLDTIAQAHEVSVATVVVNWTMNRPGITAVLCGAKRAWQIEESAAAMELQIDASELAAIEQLLLD